MKRFFLLWMACLGLMAGCATGSAVLPAPLGPVPLEGDATWYAAESKRLSAAHPDLPLGTRVRVINLLNDRRVIVTITNHIPWEGGRIIDIVLEAAKNIRMNNEGPTPVRIEVLGGRRKVSPESSVPPVDKSGPE